MGMPIMVLGESGSGKTASLRNFNKGEVFVFEVAGKELPFKNDWGNFVFQRPNYAKIKEVMLKASQVKDNKVKTFVIDDSQYLMVFENFANSKITGYGKFTDLAVNFKDLIDFVITQLPKDYTVYFLHHTTTDDNTGFVHAKTIGKMLDNQLTVEGMFTVVLKTDVSQGTYSFVTHNLDGMSTTKTPIGMFAEDKIDNDLKVVDATIRAYYDWDGQKEEK